MPICMTPCKKPQSPHNISWPVCAMSLQYAIAHSIESQLDLLLRAGMRDYLRYIIEVFQWTLKRIGERVY